MVFIYQFNALINVVNKCVYVSPLCNVLPHSCFLFVVHSRMLENQLVYQILGVLSKVCFVQERLTAGHGVQCGFCSPGMVMSMFALLRNNPQPTELEIEHAIKGSSQYLCRCSDVVFVHRSIYVDVMMQYLFIVVYSIYVDVEIQCVHNLALLN